jgi:DMSO reductase family type II enzyme heme b subunit
MGSDDSGAVDTSASHDDRIVVQFPAHPMSGSERPYFLLGSAQQPVYLWRWESEPGAATEVLASGADHLEPLPAQPDSVSATGVYDHGEWRVQFVRTLATADSTNRLQFTAGHAIAMAIFAWDGSNGETGTRMSVGSWVNIYLSEPSGAGTVVWPLLAMLGTGGLGLFVVVRTQRTSPNQPSDE